MSEAMAFSFALREFSLELSLVVLEGSAATAEGTVAAAVGSVGTGGRGAASRDICHSSLSPERGDGRAEVRGVAGRTAVGVRGGDPERDFSIGLAFLFSHAP
jgi:hypothetical protein